MTIGRAATAALTLGAAGLVAVLPVSVTGAAPRSSQSVSPAAVPAYGQPVPITDPANPTVFLTPTGVNASGTVPGFEAFGTLSIADNRPVVWKAGTATPLTTSSCAPQGAPRITGGISDQGTIVGTSEDCVLGALRVNRWTGSGAFTDLGFGVGFAMSPNDTMAGFASVDTGVPNPTGGTVFSSGPFVQPGATGAASVSPLPSFAKPGGDPFRAGFGIGQVAAVSNTGIALFNLGDGAGWRTTNGATLADFCGPNVGSGTPAGESTQLISDAGVIIGQRCSDGAGATWNATTGSATLLAEPAGSSSGVSAFAITPAGQIFGTGQPGAVVWADATSVPEALAVSGIPRFVSGDGRFLVTSANTGSQAPFTLYTAVPGSSSISIASPASIEKPPSGTATLNFAVTLGGASAQTVTVDFATADGTAIAGRDYQSTQGTLSFPPGAQATPMLIPVTIAGGPGSGPPLTFNVNLSNATNATIATAQAIGTIDEGPALSINDVQLDRGGTGPHLATFTVSLDKPPTAPVTFSYSTADGSAKAGVDYTTTGRTITLTRQLATITVPVLVNPAADGFSRTFTVSVGNVSAGVALGKGVGVATLLAGQLTVTTDKTTVWGNGHATATLTVIGTKGDGSPVVGQLVTIAASPGQGAIIKPLVAGAQFTDKAGKVQFTVASTAPIPPGSTPAPSTFTASTSGKGLVGMATAEVTFERHKTVVQFLGITTNLSCTGGTSNTCTDPDGATSAPSDVFKNLRSDAVNSFGYDPTDFLWFSYRGGRVDFSTGDWLPYSYSCADTASSYRAEVAYLRAMVTEYSRANANTDLYFIAHSQGGLIAFQQLALSDISASDQLRAVVTMDSPLGGVPLRGTAVSSLLGCWKGAAPNELAGLWGYNSAHSSGSEAWGTVGLPLCVFQSTCTTPATTNAQLATIAEANGTGVYTYGSSDDAVYVPAKCIGLRVFSVPFTQVVSTATSGGLFPFDNIFGGHGATCIHNTHVAVIDAEQVHVENILGPQIP